MTPDFSPVYGLRRQLSITTSMLVGTWDSRATPVCGKRMAETRCDRKARDLIKAF